jgi:predicted ATPase/class 3 adenylate cyclase
MAASASFAVGHMSVSECCSQCQTPLLRGARYCSACGNPTELVSVESSRRQLTVLFCDVVESTELAARLDPEDWHDLLTGYHRVCRDAIGFHHGHISQFLGDGVLAYFGYPVAQEDDAVRAIRAALRILDDVKLLNAGIGKRLRAEIHLRAGIHTGITVLTDTWPGARERLAIGDTVNLAARIQGFADEDTVVVSASTARLVGGHFELESLNSPTLKGFTRSVELFRVLRETGARSAFEAAALGQLTPYIGREVELRALEAAWLDVQQGAGRVVVVRGEAGIGKSRLVHHFQHFTLEANARIIQCFCSPLTWATALAPVVAMLQGQLEDRARGLPGGSAKLDALREMFAEQARSAADALPLMASLLSLQGVDDEAIRELSPTRRRLRTLELLREWLEWSAERVPVAVFVEDVHWADPSTLELLEPLLSKGPARRTLLCVTGRPEFGAPWSGAHLRKIELVRMNSHESEAIVTHLAGGHGLPPMVVRRISERSEGVPLFVEEVTKAVLESGALRLDGDHYALERALDDQFLPTTVQGSIVARFDRLKESRSVAQRGAAIGRDFTYALIQAVSDLPEGELRERLDVLGRSDLVFVQGEPPNARYTFKHALIQDAIYETLLRSERARVHARIFSALRERFPEVVAEHPEMAAYHAEHAGHPDAAVPLLREAGMSAFNRTAVAEAVKHLAHSLELVGVLDEPERAKTEMELQAALSAAYMATLGWAAPEVERASGRLRDLAAAMGDGERLFQAMWGLWTVHFIRGKLDLALDVAEQVRAMAMQTTDPVLHQAGHHAVGYTHFYRGEYAAAIAHADAGLALFDLERERRIAAAFQLSPATGMWCYRAQAQQMLGLLDTAAIGTRECERLTEELGHAPSRAFLLNLCYCFRMRGDLGRIKALAAGARSLSVTEGFAFWLLISDIILAWVSAQEAGDASAAAERIEMTRKLLHDGGTYIVEPEFASMHAEALLLAAKPEAAFRVLADALTVVQRDKQHHGEPELYRLQGEAANALGEPEHAAALFRRGVERARALGARLLELRSVLALVKLQSTEQLRAELRALLETFGDGLDQPDCQQAMAFLTT